MEQGSDQTDVNCTGSYSATKQFTDGWTDAEGYNIIRPFFKWACKKADKNLFEELRTFLYILIAVKPEERTKFKTHKFIK